MKLFDKLKDMFYDDVNEEKEEREVLTSYEEPIKEEKQEKEEAKELTEKEIYKSEPTFKFPVFFDEDFQEKTIVSKPSLTKKDYSITSRNPEKKKFKLSPIISPVYGIISETVAEEKSSNVTLDDLYQRQSRNEEVNLDDVFDKVTEKKKVEIEIETETTYHNDEKKITIKEEPVEIDFFADDKEVGSRVEKAKEDVNESLKNIDALLENTDEDNFYDLVDKMYKEEGEEE